MLHHDADAAICPECEDKLKTAHPYLCDWFHKRKTKSPLIHVSCAYRDAAEQERDYLAGKSQKKYPNSKHNATDKDGKPCSLALDIFLIDMDGVARWPWKFYESMDRDNQEERLPIRWGGCFKSLRDGPHFEMLQADA